METPPADKWKQAADRQMAGLEKHETFDLVSSASVPSEKVIGTKWVFEVKADHTRAVVQGWVHTPGITAVAPTLRCSLSRASG